MWEKIKVWGWRVLNAARWIVFLWNAPATATKIYIVLLAGGAAVATWFSGYGHPQILFLAALGVFLSATLLIGQVTILVDRRKRLSPVKSRVFFVGDWLVKLGHPGLPVFVLRLLDDGTAEQCEKHGPLFKSGTWKYIQGEARIRWKADGTELIRPMAGAIDILEPVGHQAWYGTYYGIPFAFGPIKWHPAERVLQERPTTIGGISLGGQPLTKLDILAWLDEHDPAYNLTLPSSRRTTAARPAEAKALYLAARTKAIEASYNPPLPTGDDEHDLLTLRQWAES